MQLSSTSYKVFDRSMGDGKKMKKSTPIQCLFIVDEYSVGSAVGCESTAEDLAISQMRDDRRFRELLETTLSGAQTQVDAHGQIPLADWHV